MKLSRIIIAAGVLALAACASTPKPTGALAEELETLTATVTAIDQTTRMVTLKDKEGGEITFKASPEVRNLAQVAAGDQVVVQFYNALAAQIQPKGTVASTEVAYDSGAARAELGERPGMVVAEAVTAEVTIEAVDLAKNRVRFVGPAGAVRDIEVKKPEMRELLKSVKPGDVVELTYFEAMAVSVEKVAPAAAK